MLLMASVVIAFVLDKLLAEPKRWHPLVGFGALASAVERRLNSKSHCDRKHGIHKRRIHKHCHNRLMGVMAVALVIAPFGIAAWLLDIWLAHWAVLHTLFAAVVLYLAIGWQSLQQHALAVAEPLARGDLDSARCAVAMIVSRDTAALDESGVARAATESVLENGADAIFSALFWFLVAGVPGVVVYRLSNTLDAMWGYKNARFLTFGWAAARLDDVLNYVPARLTAMVYALAGHTGCAWRCWQQQAQVWKSPNAGPVMSAGAGALKVLLGGAAQYHDRIQQRPPLGPVDGEQPSATTLYRACQLVDRALLIWLAAVFTVSLFGGLPGMLMGSVTGALWQ